MQTFFYYFKKILFAKWCFRLPLKKKILLYDGEGDHIMSLFFKREDYEILDIRFERINISLILMILIKRGLKDIKLNYFLEYFSQVKPEVVLTTIDNNVRFYTFKNYYKKSKFVSVQLSSRDERFYEQCRNFSKIKKETLTVDEFFVLSENEKNRLSQIIKSNFHVIGTLKNNLYNQNKNNDGKKKVLFISQIMSLQNFTLKEKPIFDELIDICKINNWELSLCTKNSRFSINEYEKIYRKILKEGSWSLITGHKSKNAYEAINNNQLIIFTNSTLGLEALIKRKKCISIPPDYFPFKGFNIKFDKEGPFWSCEFTKKKLNNLIQKVEKYSENEWDNIIKKYIDNIMYFDPGNKIFLNYLRKQGLKIKV